MVGYTFFKHADSNDESVIDINIEDVDMDFLNWDPSETEPESDPSKIPYVHEEEGDAQIAPTSDDDQNAVTQDEPTTEEEEHSGIINPRPDPDTEVPPEPPEREVKGEQEPSTPTSTEEPRAALKGAPKSTEEARANFKGAPSSTEPTRPNPEEPPEPNLGETTGSNNKGVPWDNSEIEEAAIRERHHEYTRARHKVTNSRERCVGEYLPAISEDRTRSHKVRRGGKNRWHSPIGCAPTGFWRWLSRTRWQQ